MRSFLFFIFIAIGFSSSLSSQEIIEALPRWMVSAHFNFLNPEPPINEFLTGNQIGYQVEAQYRVQYNKPFLAGIYFSESVLSKHTIKYDQSSGVGNIRIKEKANTRRVETGLTAGFYPEINWLLQPYIQGRFGLSIFQTSSILTDRDSDETIERISESTSFAPAYGLDLGIHIVPNIWYIRGDVRIGFTGNTSTDYLLLDKENAGTTGYPIDYFLEHSSAGKWLKISAGISYLF